MSSTLTEVETIPKKRKHGGDIKDPKRKKRKKLEDVEHSPTKLETKEKKSKKDKRRDEVVDGAHTNTSAELNGSSSYSYDTQKEKKKKKRIPTADESTPSEMSIVDIKDAVDSHQDEEMEDMHANANEFEATELPETFAYDDVGVEADSEQLQSNAETSFYSSRMSLYLPVPAISSSNPLPGLIALHLSPLLLTYFPPVEGVVLSYHDPIISTRPQAGPSRPLLPPDDSDEPEEALSKLGEEFGASWVWLTVTFIVFKPMPGDELKGWTNFMSEGFIGLVSYNYFQTSIARSRIPQRWKWDGPMRERNWQRKTPRKGKLNDGDEPRQDIANDFQETDEARQADAVDWADGKFIDENEAPVPEHFIFKVVDLEMIQAQEKGQRFALQLEGSLLNESEEAAVRSEEKQKWENRLIQGKTRSRTPGTPMMSGGLPVHSRASSIVSTPQ